MKGSVGLRMKRNQVPKGCWPHAQKQTDCEVEKNGGGAEKQFN